MARGDGRVYRRGNRWWIEYWHRGKQIRESAGSSEAEAGDVLRDRLAEIRTGTYSGPQAERLTVGEIVEEYLRDLRVRGAKAARKFEVPAKPLYQQLGHVRYADLDENPGLVNRYIEDRLATPSKRRPGQTLAPATVNRETGLLRASLRLAWKMRRIPRVPYIPKLREDNVRQGFIEPSEIDPIIENLPEHLRDFVRFAYITGWRPSEVKALKWSSVDWSGERPELRIPTSKNDRPRSLPLTGELLAIFERRRAVRAVETATGALLAEHVFHRQGKRLRDFRTAWKRACAAAGLDGKLLYDCRRSAARNMINAGVSTKKAMAITGHETRIMFDRYNIVSQDDKAETLTRTMDYLSERRERRVVPLVGRRRRR